MDLLVHTLDHVIGDLPLAGDRRIAHRVALLAAMADGPSCLRNFPLDSGCRTTLRILSELGIAHEELEPGTVTIFGNGGNFRPPAGILNCGSSMATARLLIGLLAGLLLETTVDGSPSLRKQNMGTTISALRQMGASITCLNERDCLPLRIRGSRLRGTHLAIAEQTSLLKDTILFAGLLASGTTSVREAVPRHDHTERAMSLASLDISLHHDVVSLSGNSAPRRFDVTIPGDISLAACWLALVAPRAGSRMILRNVSLNPRRMDFVDGLIHLGAGLREEVLDCRSGEWHGHLDMRGGTLRPFDGAEESDGGRLAEFPLLAVMAAKAEGTSRFRGLAKLRSGSLDRVSAMAANLKRMGVLIEESPDGLVIHGTGRLHRADVESFGDHRVATAMVIAGLLADGNSMVRGADCITSTYPGFLADLELIIASSKAATPRMEADAAQAASPRKILQPQSA